MVVPCSLTDGHRTRTSPRQLIHHALASNISVPEARQIDYRRIWSIDLNYAIRNTASCAVELPSPLGMPRNSLTAPLGTDLVPEVAQYFRSQLREARAAVLRDSEGFESIVLVLERLGRIRHPAGNNLGAFERTLGEVADASPLAHEVPRARAQYHLDFSTLFKLVREGRNSAVHEGALARNVTVHAVELALILENALMPPNATAGELMVRGPTIAAPWHPLSFVRQSMLANSFSYLPVRLGEGADEPWWVVSDVAVAEYLLTSNGTADRTMRLRTTLEAAVTEGSLRLDTPRCVTPEHRIADLVSELAATPILVVDDGGSGLVGIVTAFDLL